VSAIKVVYDAYAQVNRGGGPDLRVYLYHMPSNVRVLPYLPLIERLLALRGPDRGFQGNSPAMGNTACRDRSISADRHLFCLGNLDPENVAPLWCRLQLAQFPN